MTLSVYVMVPEGAGWTADVATVELRDGRPAAVHTKTLTAGEKESFYPHDGAAILIAEGRSDGARPDAGGLAIFAFALGQTVALIGSDETGKVVGRSDHAEASRSYLVRYRAGDGRLTEAWWGEAALASLAAAPTPALPASEA